MRWSTLEFRLCRFVRGFRATLVVPLVWGGAGNVFASVGVTWLLRGYGVINGQTAL